MRGRSTRGGGGGGGGGSVEVAEPQEVSDYTIAMRPPAYPKPY